MSVPLPPDRAAPPQPAPAPPQPAPAVPQPAPAGRSWWRSNALALIALLVLVPATALGIGWYEWHQFYGYGSQPITPIAVERKHTAELAGATWGPIRSGEIEDLTGFDVPEGTRLIAAAIPVAPDSEGVSCDEPRLVQQSTGREWQPLREEIGVDYSYDEPLHCSSADTEKYELIAPFLIPDDVEGPFWVDVAPQGADGSFLRFEIDP